MAVIVKYVVVRNGKENMTFSTKKEAETYDKMLDIAERLHEFLHRAEIDISADALDDLTFFMAKHRDQIGKLLRGGRLDPTDAGATASTLASDKGKPPAVAETKGRVASKPSRATKPKAVA